MKKLLWTFFVFFYASILLAEGAKYSVEFVLSTVSQETIKRIYKADKALKDEVFSNGKVLAKFIAEDGRLTKYKDIQEMPTPPSKDKTIQKVSYKDIGIIVDFEINKSIKEVLFAQINFIQRDFEGFIEYGTSESRDIYPVYSTIAYNSTIAVELNSPILLTSTRERTKRKNNDFSEVLFLRIEKI